MNLFSRKGNKHAANINKQHNLKHSSKLISLLIILASLVIIAATTISSARRMVLDQANAVNRRMQLNSNVAISIEQQIINSLERAEQVAAFTSYVYVHDYSNLDISEWIEHDLLIDTDINVINIIDADGQIAIDSGFVLYQDYSEKPLFKEIKGNPEKHLIIDKPVYDQEKQRWLLPMYRRIENDTGEFAGMILLAIDPKSLGNFFKNMDLPTAFLEVSGSDGLVRSRVVGEELELDKDKNNLTWNYRQIHSDMGTYVDNGKYIDGLSRIVAYRPIAGYDLTVTVGTDYKSAVAMVDATKKDQIISIIIVDLAVVFLASIFIFLLRRQEQAVLSTESNEALFRATFSHAAMGIARISPEGTIIETNPKFQRLLGYDKDELIDKNIIDLLDDEYKHDAKQFMDDRLTEFFLGMPPEIERVYVDKKGNRVWVHEALSVVRKSNGLPDFLVSAIQDITARKNLESQLSHAASHDVLTGLPNRLLLKQNLARTINLSRQNNTITAVLFMDLNDFKDINDQYGHSAGDELLKEVADRISSAVRVNSGDMVIRYGGDEFTVMLAGIKDIADCELVAKKVAYKIKQPYALWPGATVTITTSIGAAFCPMDTENIDDLISYADFAMYYAKNNNLIYSTWQNANGELVELNA